MSELSINPEPETEVRVLRGPSGLVDGYDDWEGLRQRLKTIGDGPSIAMAEKISQALRIDEVGDGR